MEVSGDEAPEADEIVEAATEEEETKEEETKEEDTKEEGDKAVTLEFCFTSGASKTDEMAH
jgi:hypothetical protein